MHLAHPLAMVQTKFLEVFQGLRMAQNLQRHLQPPLGGALKKSQLELKRNVTLSWDKTRRLGVSVLVSKTVAEVWYRMHVPDRVMAAGFQELQHDQ